MKKEQNGRESLKRLKLIVGCNAGKRRRNIPKLYKLKNVASQFWNYIQFLTEVA